MLVFIYFSSRCLAAVGSKAPGAPEKVFLLAAKHREHPKGYFYQQQGTGNIRKGISISSKAPEVYDNQLLSAAIYRKYLEFFVRASNHL